MNWRYRNVQPILRKRIIAQLTMLYDIQPATGNQLNQLGDMQGYERPEGITDRQYREYLYNNISKQGR